VPDETKRVRLLVEAASDYIAAGHQDTALKLAEDLPNKEKSRINKARLIYATFADTHEALRTVTTIPDVADRTSVYRIIRAKFLRESRLDLVRQTLGEDQDPYARSSGMDSLSEMLVRQNKPAQALEVAITIPDQQLRKTATLRAQVAQFVVDGETDFQAAAKTKNLSSEDLDHGLTQVAHSRIEVGDFDQARALGLKINRVVDRISIFTGIAAYMTDHGHPDTARPFLDEAEKWLPDTEPLYRDLAQDMIAHVRSFTDPAQEAQRLENLPPDEQDAYSPYLIRALVKSGKVQQAVARVQADPNRELLMLSFPALLASGGYFQELRNFRDSLSDPAEKAQLCLSAAMALIPPDVATQPTP
jgi:hypothetical protein